MEMMIKKNFKKVKYEQNFCEFMYIIGKIKLKGHIQ